MKTQTKTVKLDDRTHARVKKLAQKDGRIISPLVSELVNEALNARIESSKLQSAPEQ